ELAADAVEVDDRHRIDAVGAGQTREGVTLPHHDVEPRDAHWRDAQDLARLERETQSGIRPRDLAERNLQVFRDRFERVAGRDRVDQRGPVRQRRCGDVNGRDDAAVTAV